jgi:hypothetical protein
MVIGPPSLGVDHEHIGLQGCVTFRDPYRQRHDSLKVDVICVTLYAVGWRAR